MNISDLRKVLNDIEEKYGDIEIITYSEEGYTVESEYIRVLKRNKKFYVFIGEDCVDRHDLYDYEKHIPYKEAENTNEN